MCYVSIRVQTSSKDDCKNEAKITTKQTAAVYKLIENVWYNESGTY